MKKIICLVLAVLMTCALMACNSTKTSDIDDLQQKITELQEQLNRQSDKSKELQEQLEQQSSKNSELENELNSQKSQFEDELKKQEEKDRLLEELLASYERGREILKRKLDNYMGKEIEFTAQEPKFRHSLPDGRALKTFYGPETDSNEALEDCEKLGEYITNELKQEYDCDFYLLKPQFECPNYIYIVNAVYDKSLDDVSGKISEIALFESFNIYDEALGDETWQQVDYHAPYLWSVSFTLHLKTLPKEHEKNPEYLKRNLSLEFGRCDDTDWDYCRDYINIYVDDTCVGTCFYVTNAYISQTWFENYFKNNLF